MTKKIVALLLAFVMLLGLLAGCSQSEEPSDPTKASVSDNQQTSGDNQGEQEPVVEDAGTITMMIASAHEIDENTWWIQQIKKHTGVTVIPLTYSLDVYNEKFNTYLASGELPDLVQTYDLTIQIAEVNKYGEQGAFVNIREHLDEMPNFKSFVIDNPDYESVYAAYASASGANYSLPVVGLNRDVNFGNMYRADVFEELGIEPWTDSESFYQAALKIKEAYPDAYVLGGTGWNSVFNRFAASWGMNDTVRPAYDYETNEWYLAGVTENMHEMLDYFQKLHTEGLLDPGFFSDDLDTFQAKMLNDQLFVTNNWIGRMAILNPQGQVNDADYDLVYGMPFGNGLVPELTKLDWGGVLVANNENSEAALKVMDWLYSEEGSFISSVGVEGENFTYGEDGKLVYADIEGNATIQTLEEKYGMWLQGYYVRPRRESVYFSFTDHEQAAQDLINEGNRYLKAAPPLIISDDIANEYTMLWTEYKAEYDAFLINYITNSEYGDEEWNEWVANVEAKYSRICELLNK